MNIRKHVLAVFSINDGIIQIDKNNTDSKTSS